MGRVDIRPMLRPGAMLLALACVSAGLSLAVSHPLRPLALSAAFAVWALANGLWPRLWLFWLPALLPVMNFSPWTGWLIFEEFDVLVLGIAAGGYARLAGQPGPGAGMDWRGIAGRPGFRLMGLLVLWGGVSLIRGCIDAGGFEFGWFQGYGDSLNSLRAGKSLFFAFLLLPLLQREMLHRAGQSVARLAAGLVAGLVIVVLAVWWERAAFPGLLNFSSHYRTTALFWEMHVGGAALDGYLVLALPFALYSLLAAARRRYWLAAAAFVLAAGYACLTTFSRGLYLGLAAGLALLGWRLAVDWDDGALRLAMPVEFRYLGRWLLAGLAALLVFYLARYGGALAMLLLLAAAFLRGGMAGVRHMPQGWRLQGAALVTLALMIELMAVLTGGSFMLGRLDESEQDFGSRWQHWREGTRLLQTPADWLLGKGLGRFPARYAALQPAAGSSPDYRLGTEAGNRYVRLFGPAPQGGADELFRLAQRVPAVPGDAWQVHLDVRTVQAADLRFRVCEKHLLYEGRCLGGRFRVRPGARGWQAAEVPLTGQPLTGGPWYAPRLAFFAIDLTGRGQAADIDNVRLLGPDGRQWLANGDFSGQLARWFPTPRHAFRRWHIDNLGLEVLLDEGLVGLALFTAWALSGLGRLLAGEARHHALAPFLAAALGGFLVVGMFSSLLDVPRVAFLFHFLLIIAFLLPAPVRTTARDGEKTAGDSFRLRQ